jgi:ParB-like chromosome segregation protein Spo0J
VTTLLPSLTIQEVPLDQLRPDPANPRRIGEDELDALERSLRQFGFVGPTRNRKSNTRWNLPQAHWRRP